MYSSYLEVYVYKMSLLLSPAYWAPAKIIMYYAWTAVWESC